MADMKTEDLSFEARGRDIDRLDELVVKLKKEVENYSNEAEKLRAQVEQLTTDQDQLLKERDETFRIAKELHERACKYLKEIQSHHQKQRRGLWCEVIMEHGSNPERNAQIADLYLKEFDERFPCPSLSYQSSQPTSSQPTTNEQPEKQPTTSQPELDPVTLKINEASR